MSTALPTRRPAPGREAHPSQVSISLVDSLYKDGGTFLVGTILVTGPAFIIYWKTGEILLLSCALAIVLVACVRGLLMYAYFRMRSTSHELGKRQTMGASLSRGSNRHPRPTWSMVFRRFLAILGPIRLFLQLFGDDYLRGGNFRTKLCKPSLCIRADFLRVDADGGRAPALRKSLSLDLRRLSRPVLSWDKIYGG